MCDVRNCWCPWNWVQSTSKCLFLTKFPHHCHWLHRRVLFFGFLLSLPPTCSIPFLTFWSNHVQSFHLLRRRLRPLYWPWHGPFLFLWPIFSFHVLFLLHRLVIAFALTFVSFSFAFSMIFASVSFAFAMPFVFLLPPPKVYADELLFPLQFWIQFVLA